MEVHLADKSTQSRAALKVLGIGLLAGTLDITYAIVFSHFRRVTPAQIFRFIASGLLGMKAFAMGSESVALGVLFHYLIALIWTVIFYAASRKLLVLTRRPVICGLFYGLLVYIFMNWVVLPLSGIPHSTKPVALASRINGVLAVMLCIGLTIALLVSRNLSPKN